jgi:glutathione S-transferase
MSSFTLVIGNKNYSSWSLRPWLVLKQLGINFQEIRIPLNMPTTAADILRYSPAGKVPILRHDNLIIWESLAICDYLADCFPDAHLWPHDRQARAIARAVSAEMHAGFQSLRQSMPMNCRARLPGKGMNPGVQLDIDRITSLWQSCRQEFGGAGDFLFGHFTIADAMFAPVVSRFMTYNVQPDNISATYMNTIWSLPPLQDWVQAAGSELERIEAEEL